MVSKSKVAIVEDPVAEAPDASEPVDMSADLKKKELIETIVARSDLKKGVTRDTLDAAFSVIAEALAAGRGVNIPPLGKIAINKERTNPSGETVLITKIKLASGQNDAPTTQEPDDTK